MAKYRF